MKSYFLHTRPQSFLVTFFAALTGYALSADRPHITIELLKDLGLMFLVFSMLLWGGTNAFNSGQDGNDGPLTLLPKPPPVPKFLSLFGLVLMLFAVAVAFFISKRLMVWTAICALLSILYSWKNPLFRRGKDIPVVDMLINAFGFGFCSILFGFMMRDGEIGKTILLIGAGFSFAYLGGMPTSQIFQLNRITDTTNNYTTLVGVPSVLKLGAFFFVLHILFLGYSYTDVSFLKNNIAAMLLWVGWILLVLISSIHSFTWSRHPFKDSYKRMNRQMIMMMGSQFLWTSYAWIHSINQISK
jgi:4-hydroxybenzoate polyprenyltransferase